MATSGSLEPASSPNVRADGGGSVLRERRRKNFSARFFSAGFPCTFIVHGNLKMEQGEMRSGRRCGSAGGREKSFRRGRSDRGAPGRPAKGGRRESSIKYWRDTAVSVNSASHAGVTAGLRAKRWRRCARAGLLSDEAAGIRSAGTVMMVEPRGRGSAGLRVVKEPGHAHKFFAGTWEVLAQSPGR